MPAKTRRLINIACAKAKARLEKFGSRSSILCCDVLELTGDRLGQFDIIYASGLIFVVPPDVRAHLLALISFCLRPGGVAMISHYAGAVPQARAELHHLLRGKVPPNLPPQEAVAAARAVLSQLITSATSLQRTAAEQSASQPDATFFHEVFNPFFVPLSTGDLERELGPSGLMFLGHVEGRASFAAGSAARAREADARDRVGGSYHYSLFGKGEGAPDMAAPLLSWSTRLRRVTGELYRLGESATTALVAHAPTRALLDAIAVKPCPFLEASPAMERSQTAQYLFQMWQDRLVSPVRQG